MNIVSQHSELSLISILNDLNCDFLNNCFTENNYTLINEQHLIEELHITFLAVCSDINSVYLLSAVENVSENTCVENLRFSLNLLNNKNEIVGNNRENLCKEIKINNIIYTLSVIDIKEPLELSNCTINLIEIRRNRKTLIKSARPITEVKNNYKMPITENACIAVDINSCDLNSGMLSYEFTVTASKNEFNYNMLISLSNNLKPLLGIMSAKSSKPCLIEYNRINNSNKYKCIYDLSTIKINNLNNYFFYYYSASIDIAKCNISFAYDLKKGYNGISHVIKVDKAIDINGKLFKVKEFRIGNITTRIIIDGSLLSICDSVDNVLKIYNGKKKLELISAKCTSKKTIYEFKTDVKSSNTITVKIADKFL